MFICAELIKDVKIGEVIVVRNDVFGSGIGGYLISGEKVATVSSRQADGCVDFWTIASKIENNKILCRAAIKGGRLLILSTDSKVFSSLSSRPNLIAAAMR